MNEKEMEEIKKYCVGWEIMVYCGDRSFSYGIFTDPYRADDAFKVVAEEWGFTRKEINRAIRDEDSVFRKTTLDGEEVDIAVMQWTRGLVGYIGERDTQEILGWSKEGEDAK